MWNPDHIAETAAAGLLARAQALTAEQAVRGIDALSEVELHPLLAAAFGHAGLGVFREQPYPGEAALRPRHAARERCDLVLGFTPGFPLQDPVKRLMEVDAADGTLFADAAPAMLAAGPAIDPADAMWIEIKSVGQYCYKRGVPGPNRTYSGEILTIAGSDIPKLAKDPVIRFASVLVILFTESEEVARHDLTAFLHRCLDKELPVAAPAQRGFSIPDIIGNRWCTVAVVPVRPGH
jgi:hypothetical protein